MDKKKACSAKTNIKNKKIKVKKKKNNQNEIEDKIVITTKNELLTKDINNNLQDLSDTYKY